MTALRKYERVWYDERAPSPGPQTGVEVFMAYDFADALAQSNELERQQRRFQQLGFAHRRITETRPHVPLVDEEEEDRKALASLFPDQPEAITRHLQRIREQRPYGVKEAAERVAMLAEHLFAASRTFLQDKEENVETITLACAGNGIPEAVGALRRIIASENKK